MYIKTKLILLLSIFTCVNVFANKLASNNPLLDDQSKIKYNLKDSTIQKLWQFKTEGKPGKASIDRNGTVYVISRSETNTKLYVISADGKEKWRADLPNQNYAPPTSDLDGNIYIYGQDMSVTAFFPNGVVKWRTNLPSAKNEVGSTDTALKVNLFYPLIYATTSQGRIFIIYSSGGTPKLLYSPQSIGHTVISSVDLIASERPAIAFVWNSDEGDYSELHRMAPPSKPGNKITRFQGKINFLDMIVYPEIMYAVQKHDKTNLLMALNPYGSIYWTSPVANENTKLVALQDIQERWRKFYYTDIESNQNVIIGVDQREGKVIFKTYLNVASVIDIFAFKNNVITVNSLNPEIQNITVFDNTSGKQLCESNPLKLNSIQATSYEGKVYLSSSSDISAFQTCASS